MQKLNQILILLIALLVVSLVVTPQHTTLALPATSSIDLPHVSQHTLNTATDMPVGSTPSRHRQLTETFRWPEVGLAFPYPAEFTLVNDPSFDFVLLGPSTGEQGGFLFIAMQSGSMRPEENLQTIMESIAGDLGNTLVEISLGEALAWQFTQVADGQHTIIIGFESAKRQVSILLLSAPETLWSDWEATFAEVIARATITPLELDHELLNAQMQASLEADGSLTVGDPAAPVLVVEFMDFSCPHCVTYRHAIDRLVQDYVMTGKARLTLTVMTFVGGDLSIAAAQAQYCAAKFGIGWDAHELIFDETVAQGREVAFTRDNLLAAVENADWGVEMDTFSACLDESFITDALTANNSFANNVGLQGTPTVYVGTSRDDLVIQQSRALLVIYENLDTLIEQVTESE